MIQAYSTTIWGSGWISIPRGNYTNIIVSFSCWVFSLEREWCLYRISTREDEKINSRSCYLDSEQNKVVRSEMVKLGDKVYLNYGDVTPAKLDVLEIVSRLGDGSTDTHIGAYYNRESSGEDISQLIGVGDTIPTCRRLTRPNISIIGEVIEYASHGRPVRERRCGDVSPNFLDRARIFADVAGLLLLFTIALSMTASAFALEVSEGQIPSPLRIFQHLLASTISANTLIPSMRMTLLYNVYNLVLTLCFRAIKVNSYHSMARLEGLKQVTFDKTGTLTETCLYVDGYYTPPESPINTLSGETCWEKDDLEFALSIGNSQSNRGPDGIWGTSPEENEILKFWEKRGYILECNPLDTKGIIRFISPQGISLSLRIMERHPYCFGKGKTAKLMLNNEIEVRVRQDGTSFLAVDSTGEGQEWAEAIEKLDKRRSMSIGFCSGVETEWRPVSTFCFENPLREGVETVMKFCLEEGITPSILTGDGREAAEELARRSGLAQPLIRIWATDSASEIWSRLSDMTQGTVSIEGKTLETWLTSEPETTRALLCAPHLCLVICRASSRLKGIVAHHIPNLMHVGDAANDAEALGTADVGVCLDHGADVCRVTAGIIVRSPIDLIDLLCLNGYRDMLLRGGQRLLRDVCWMAGLTAGCLAIAIHRNRFRFLEGSSLYLDAWNPLPMLVISSLQYTISVVGYSSADCSSSRLDETHLIMTSIMFMALGLGMGICVSWAIRHYFAETEFEYLLLHSIDLLLLSRHSQHCLRWRKITDNRDEHGLAPRRAYSSLGNQRLSRQGGRLGLVLSAIDSLPGRMLLYALFYYLPLW
jgi:magnesium-transporting ATPase (P-type)